jgi:hypothetical protein
MGLCIGTLYWKGLPDEFYVAKLETLATKHGLNIMNNYPVRLIDKYTNHFNVGLGGFWLTWYGKDECMTKIDKFLIEGQTLLNRFGLETKIKTEFLLS